MKIIKSPATGLLEAGYMIFSRLRIQVRLTQPEKLNLPIPADQLGKARSY